MEEIITVNGQQYQIDTIVPLTQAQRNELISQLGGNPQSTGCSSCSSQSISTLATGCPTTAIPVGTTKTFTCNATGIGPFVFTLSINNVAQPSSAPISSLPWVTTYTFNAPGTSIPVSLKVVDSCTGTTLYATDSCPLGITVQTRTLASMTVGGCTTSIGTAPPSNTCTVSVTGVDQFGAAFTPTGVTYSSSNTSIATVNSTSGLVTGVNAGTVTITATSGTITATKSVTVTCTVPTCNFVMS